MSNLSEPNYRDKLIQDRTRDRWISDHGERMLHRERETPQSERKNSTEKPVNTLAKKPSRWPF